MFGFHVPYNNTRMRSVIILMLVIIQITTIQSQLFKNVTIDIGNCTQLSGYVKSCLREVSELWEFDGDFNTIFSEPYQYCCAIWDYMYCAIDHARDLYMDETCTFDELDYVIEATIAEQKSLQNGHCYYYTRDAWFECRVLWYDMLILIILFIAFSAAVIMVVVNNCRQYNRKPEKFRMVQVYV